MTSSGTPTRGRSRALPIAFASLGLLSLAGCAVQSAQAITGSDGTTTTASTYADGTYTADAAYRAPGGTDSITVELAISGDIITAVSVSGESDDREGREYIDRFAAAISSEVVGKDISTLSVSRVAGSSLTSNGFTSALEEIRSQAS